MLHTYQSKDTALCLASRRVVFIGDSVTRSLYFHFMHVVDPKLPFTPPDDDHKHSNYSFTSDSATALDFFWDPYLNTSNTLSLVHGHLPSLGVDDRPAMLVLGSGLWYLRCHYRWPPRLGSEYGESFGVCLCSAEKAGR